MIKPPPSPSRPAPVCAAPGGGLNGRCAAPGDKSISHRALIIGAMARGETSISGLLEGEDVLATAAAAAALGPDVRRDGEGRWRVAGRPWTTSEETLDFGNSGTGARLMLGAAAGARIAAQFDGDASLRSRPMGRVIEPLTAMGAELESANGRLPISLKPERALRGICFAPPAPSAQVKSAILLAGLAAEGVTDIFEAQATRDHTELMLKAFGAEIETIADGEGRRVRLTPGALEGTAINVPGDPSSAAFPLVAALITPRSEITVTGVGLNPLRTGLFSTLLEMGADLSFSNVRVEAGEKVGDVTARSSKLRAAAPPPSRAPSMIDEYPVLAVACAFSEGISHIRGAKELRVKESDRIAAIGRMLSAAGAAIELHDDGFAITGAGEAGPPGGGRIEAWLDHRIAMSALVLGLAAKGGMELDDSRVIATSYPNFAETMTGLGATLEAGL